MAYVVTYSLQRIRFTNFQRFERLNNNIADHAMSYVCSMLLKVMLKFS